MDNKFLELVHKGKNEWWRYILASGVIFLFWFIIGSIPLVYTFFTLPGGANSPFEMNCTSVDENYSCTRETSIVPDFASLKLDPAVTFFLFWFSFLTLIIGVYVAIKFVHKRPFLSLITPKKSINWRRIFAAFAVFFLLIVIFDIIDVALGLSKVDFVFKIQDLPFFLLVLLLIPFQTTAEELLFRSYTMQGIYLKTKNIFLIIILSSVNFAIFHGLNPEVSEISVLVMLFYLIAAAFLAFITIKDGSLELALGLHAANNLSALVLNYQGSALSAPSLFLESAGAPVLLSLAQFCIVLAIFYFIFFRKIKKN